MTSLPRTYLCPFDYTELYAGAMAELCLKG
jgi:hypothetical protein